jgi:hypothetical protein
MRTIEQGFNLFINKLLPEFNAVLLEIDEILNVDIPKFSFGNVAVGTNPPAGVQLTDFSTTETIATNASGEASIDLSALGFSYGYNALVTPNWPGLMPSLDLGASTLVTLWLNFQDTTGAYGPDTFSVTVLVKGA